MAIRTAVKKRVPASGVEQFVRVHAFVVAAEGFVSRYAGAAQSFAQFGNGRVRNTPQSIGQFDAGVEYSHDDFFYDQPSQTDAELFFHGLNGFIQDLGHLLDLIRRQPVRIGRNGGNGPGGGSFPIVNPKRHNV